MPTPRKRPTARHSLEQLGRRERQIMEILHRLRRATAADVQAELPDPPSNSAVRGMLRYLESKQLVRHTWDGPRHVWSPTGNAGAAGESAMRSVLRNFFQNSRESALAAMLGADGEPLTDQALDRLAKLIDDARSGRKAR